MYKLMIVDDSSIIRNKIERCSDNGVLFEVVYKATNGCEAVEGFKRYQPELVTMDLTMPSMDGLECIQNLKALDPKVKILVVSALSDKATGIRALKYGAKGFVCKPFSEEELMTAINRLITG